MSRVFITGIGFISSIGNDSAEVSNSLRTLKHGMELMPELAGADSPVKVAAPVKGFDVSSLDPEDWSYPARYRVRRETLRSFSPHVMYAHCSLLQAIEDASLKEDDISNLDTGIYTASAGSMKFIYNNYKRLFSKGVMRCNPLTIVSSIAGTLSFNLVSHFNIRGVSTGFSSACASSGHAMGFAFDEIQRGRQKRMFVVGAEECNFENIVPFAGMRALSLSTDPDTAACSFDKKRQGFVATGGGVTLVLESEEEVKRRGAKVYAEMIGWGQGSDGHNVAISHPEGRGLQNAMRLALKDANLEPAGIDYINAHAPSTGIGDLSEVKAIKAIFETAGAKPKISSTKPLTGHGLSLSSVLEAGICSLVLKEGFLPGSAHITELEPAAESLNIIRETEDTQVSVVMSNSSGFGGANTSLIFKSCQG